MTLLNRKTTRSRLPRRFGMLLLPAYKPFINIFAVVDEVDDRPVIDDEGRDAATGGPLHAERIRVGGADERHLGFQPPALTAVHNRLRSIAPSIFECNT